MKSEGNLNKEDILFTEALTFVISIQYVSISSVQRKLNIGYNKAACLIMKMEQKKYITPPNNKGKRTVLRSISQQACLQTL